MKIVIDIPEEIYNDIKTHPLFLSDIPAIERAIKNGTPLPKGHWINAEQKVTAQLYDDQYEEYKEEEMTIEEYLDRYTNEGCPGSIIEADKENEECR